jgi:hypothetical protein
MEKKRESGRVRGLGCVVDYARGMWCTVHCTWCVVRCALCGALLVRGVQYMVREGRPTHVGREGDGQGEDATLVWGALRACDVGTPDLKGGPWGASKERRQTTSALHAWMLHACRVTCRVEECVEMVPLPQKGPAEGPQSLHRPTHPNTCHAQMQSTHTHVPMVPPFLPKKQANWRGK